MRIIAGLFRGRKLVGPEGLGTRPITDRVKQSLFDILTPLLADSIVYDCFAGTGSMGLESLSRGCSFATFFESGASAVSRLGRNISTIGVQDRSRIRNGAGGGVVGAGAGPYAPSSGAWGAGGVSARLGG
jgi:16S rRNA (guanine966-N2)-methyltransferase